MSFLPQDDKPSPLVLMDLIQGFKIRDVMSRTLITAERKTTLLEIRNLMRHNNISGVPIVEGKRLLGLISVEDLLVGFETCAPSWKTG